MKAASYNLELLTPCFCAGADQAKAEIRPSSIRGQLRWWFRALGGSAADERSIFGGVAGTASASTLIVRVGSLEQKPWSPPSFTQNDPESYVWYFASVSGTTAKGANGPRWNSAGAIGPGSKFTIQILQRQPLVPSLQAQLDAAVSYFLQFGAVGLRATRGLGAFSCREQPYSPASLDALKTKGFAFEIVPVTLSSTTAIAREIGSLVKGTRKATGMKADKPSPFGSSTPVRQTSAIYFRPVRLPSSNDCTLVVLEAPHARVLGKESDQPRVIGHPQTRLAKPEPVRRRW